MKKNAFAIGVSNLEYMNIMMTYYPRGIQENYDIYLFVDNRKDIIDELKEMIARHNVPVFNNATIINVKDLYDHYQERYQYEGEAKNFMYNHGCVFKILMPQYLWEKYDVKKVYTSDDDVFILNDLSSCFDEYSGWAFKKENLFYLRNADKYKMIDEYNSMFGTSFKLEELNRESVNAGNVMYDYDPKFEEYVHNFISNQYVHHLYKNNPGYTSWTLEQRFQHFNLHRLKSEGVKTDFIKGKDLRLVLSIADEAPDKFLKNVTPSLLHYAVGVKKPFFLRQFLPGIAWKYNGLQYEPLYELSDILYNKDWEPTRFKQLDVSRKTKSVF
jgi:hypothetical protein